MQRLNQSANTECCSGEGQADKSQKGALSRTTSEKRTQGTERAASESRTSLKQFSVETSLNADGEKVFNFAPEAEGAIKGEALEGLPASKSVASPESDCGNLGDPGASGRSHWESQPGRSAQRQGEQPRSAQGFRLVHSSSEQPGASQEGTLGTLLKIRWLSDERVLLTPYEREFTALVRLALQKPPVSLEVYGLTGLVRPDGRWRSGGTLHRDLIPLTEELQVPQREDQRRR
jgi:hypothetical protein